MNIDENAGTELDKYIDDISEIPPEDEILDDDATLVEGEDREPVDKASTDETPQDQVAKESDAPDQNAESPQQGEQLVEGKKDATSDELRPIGNGAFTDKEGNIVTGDGKLVAEKGFAARMYHKTRRLTHRVEEQDKLISDLQKENQERNVLSETARNYNLSTDEVAQALDLAGRMKRGDVLSVAKDVIALVTANGYNVTDLLGEDVGDSIDMRGIKQMLDQRLGPVEQQRAEQQDAAEAEKRGRLAYSEFVKNNQFADLHANEIVAVMQRENKTPQQAYNSLVMFASRNGLDISLPLGPQIQERQKQLGQQQQKQNSVRPKPLPNGANTGQPNITNAEELAHPDDDWGSIIRQVQQSTG